MTDPSCWTATALPNEPLVATMLAAIPPLPKLGSSDPGEVTVAAPALGTVVSPASDMAVASTEQAPGNLRIGPPPLGRPIRHRAQRVTAASIGRSAVFIHGTIFSGKGAVNDRVISPIYRKDFSTSRIGSPDTGDSVTGSTSLSLYYSSAILIAMTDTAKRKTSFEVDFAKVEAAKAILGTRTLTDTVAAALDEVIKLQQRRRLVELLFTPGQLQLDDPEVMAGAWR
jgi:hypothetical protein